MKWGVHIDAAISKANKRLNGIRRIRFLITREARIVLYKALILPVLEYANVLYDNCSIYLKQRLESIQRQAAIMCTGAFVNTSYTKLLNELGWASLEERRNFFRLSYLYKMSNKKVPKYLSDLMPLTVGDRTEYNLRNVGNLSLIRTNHVKTYNSFIPKSIRDWNSLGPLRECKSLEGFKTMYRREFLKRPNPIHSIDHEGGNVHLTRLRLGLSHLSEHLYTHNLIDSPLCINCGLENESTAHYLLRCPLYATQRAVFLAELLNVVDANHLMNLRDNDIVNLFLYGDSEFPFQSNIMLNKIAQTYIIDSKRFQGRAYH